MKICARCIYDERTSPSPSTLTECATIAIKSIISKETFGTGTEKGEKELRVNHR